MKLCPLTELDKDIVNTGRARGLRRKLKVGLPYDPASSLLDRAKEVKSQTTALCLYVAVL